MKKITAFIMALLTTLSVSLMGGCANGSKGQGLYPPKANANEEAKNEITATIVRPGETYAFQNEIAFLGSDIMPTADDGYVAVSADLVATVEPAGANQNVNWSVAFVNPSSTWAKGKTVTNYVTISPKSSGSTTATVTCKAPFGEQIKITCSSQENAAISASCTVDFLRNFDISSLHYGDLEINLGGITDVTMELENSGGLGGVENMQLVQSDSYTIDQSYYVEVVMVEPGYYLEGTEDIAWGSDAGAGWSIGSTDGYFILNGHDLAVGNGGSYWSSPAINTTRELYFNRHDCLGIFGVRYGEYGMLHQLDVQTIIDDYFCKIDNGYFSTLRVRIYKGSDNQGELYKEYKSLINVTGYTYNPKVASISLNNSSLQF